jgi:hypothetical protein
VSLRGHPPFFGGAFIFSNRCMLLTCLVIVHGWQPAALAIWEWVSSLLKIISRINSRVDGARLGPFSRPTRIDVIIQEGSFVGSWGYIHGLDGYVCTRGHRLVKYCALWKFQYHIIHEPVTRAFGNFTKVT